MTQRNGEGAPFGQEACEPPKAFGALALDEMRPHSLDKNEIKWMGVIKARQRRQAVVEPLDRQVRIESLRSIAKLRGRLYGSHRMATPYERRGIVTGTGTHVEDARWLDRKEVENVPVHLCEGETRAKQHRGSLIIACSS